MTHDETFAFLIRTYHTSLHVSNHTRLNLNHYFNITIPIDSEWRTISNCLIKTSGKFFIASQYTKPPKIATFT